MRNKKLACLPLFLLMVSCKPSFNKSFEKVMQDVTGMQVSYDEEALKESKKSGSDIQFYVYKLDGYSDAQQSKMQADYKTLCDKFDSIMVNEYECKDSKLKAEREHAQYMSKINKSKDSAADELSEFYFWSGKEGLCLEISIHEAATSKEESFIDVTLSRPNK